MTAPRLSVVVAASHSGHDVTRCLQALGRSANVEIIVVARGSIERPPDVDAGVTWISADSQADVHCLRGLGLQHSRASLVAFTEDSCVPAPGWTASWIDAFSNSPDRGTATVASERRGVGTGCVLSSPDASALDRAVFLCEYVPFLPPLNRALGGRLAGNNFAAKRDVLECALSAGEVHEWTLYGRDDAVLVPRALCIHIGRHNVSGAVRDRLRCGYQFGRLRGSVATPRRRFLMASLGAGILASQLWRLMITLWVKRAFDWRTLCSLPWTMILLASWSLGEWAGWMTAPAPQTACKPRETEAQLGALAPGPADKKSRRYTRVRSSA